MTERETRETESAGAPDERSWHPVWSVHREWSGHFLVLSGLLTVASIAWVYVVTGSGLETLGYTPGCILSSFTASLYIIEGGGWIMLSTAERWRRFKEEPQRIRDETRAETTVEVTAEVTARVNAAWDAWLARKQAADEAGEEFTEPSPSAALNGDA